MGAIDRLSKELQRDQATLSGDKELKANTLRSNGDQISRKTVELGKLRAQADQRKRDEAALRELEGYLGQLQADLKVSRWGFLKLYS
jgi:DNA repair protein RAD50